MKQYLDLLDHTLTNSTPVETRNGIRHTIYGHQMRFNFENGFPILTTKKIRLRTVAAELCWFLRGYTNTSYLHKWDCHIWDANADQYGECGNIYGFQWRNFNGDYSDEGDQITTLIRNMRLTPNSTRLVVNAWNPLQLHDMKLPPCHFGFQVHCLPESKISLQVSMRSTDVCLGLPFNISSYALLLMLLCKVVGKIPHELIMDLGNVHIYDQHVPNAEKQLYLTAYSLPEVQIVKPINRDLWGLDPDVFEIYNYEHGPFLPFDLIP